MPYAPRELSLPGEAGGDVKVWLTSAGTRPNRRYAMFPLAVADAPQPDDKATRTIAGCVEIDPGKTFSMSWQDARADKNGVHINVKVDGISIDTIGDNFSDVSPKNKETFQLRGVYVSPTTYRPFRSTSRRFQDESAIIKPANCPPMLNTIVVDMWRFEGERCECSRPNFKYGNPSALTFSTECRERTGEVGIGFGDEIAINPKHPVEWVENEATDYLEHPRKSPPQYRFIILYGSTDWLNAHGFPIQEVTGGEAQKTRPEGPAKGKELPHVAQGLPTPEPENAPEQNDQDRRTLPTPGSSGAQAMPQFDDDDDDLYASILPERAHRADGAESSIPERTPGRGLSATPQNRIIPAVQDPGTSEPTRNTKAADMDVDDDIKPDQLAAVFAGAGNLIDLTEDTMDIKPAVVILDNEFEELARGNGIRTSAGSRSRPGKRRTDFTHAQVTQANKKPKTNPGTLAPSSITKSTTSSTSGRPRTEPVDAEFLNTACNILSGAVKASDRIKIITRERVIKLLRTREGDPDWWHRLLERFLDEGFDPEVRQVAEEIYCQQLGAGELAVKQES